METDVHIFTADGATTVSASERSLESFGLTEVGHLERWVVAHPKVLGGDVLVITTQYDRWSSTSGDRAKERPDILGLDSSGQPVVVELKRGSDSKIHLQAITYASLVAGFSEETLARAHADYLSRTSGAAVSVGEARSRISAHVDEDVELEATLRVPRIVLIAEQFTAQTYTTVRWLGEIAPNLKVELRTVNAFELPGQENPCIVFRRLYPSTTRTVESSPRPQSRSRRSSRRSRSETNGVGPRQCCSRRERFQLGRHWSSASKV
jgi:hypothetical protein